MEGKLGKDDKTQIADLDFDKLTLKADTPTNARDEADLQPNSLNFRIASKYKQPKPWDVARFSKYFALILVLLFACTLTLRYVDDVREMLIEDVKGLAAASKKKKIGKIAVPVLGQVSLALKALRPVNQTVELVSSTNPDATCSAFISESINKKLKTKLSDQEFLHFVNCQLFQDGVSVAQQTLKRADVQPGQNVTWDKLALHLYAMEAQRRLDALSPQALFSRPICVRWAATPECMLRYVDESQRSFKSRWQDGSKVLESALADKGVVERAWFYLASSLNAAKDNEFQKSEAFLLKAHKALEGSANPFLEREIYHVATVSAFLSGDAALMKKAKALRPRQRVEEDPRAFLDVDLLERIPSVEARELIADFLLAPEAKNRFFNDPRFIDILLRNTQIYNLNAEGYAYAQRVFGRDPSASALRPNLVFLYARIAIGAGKGDEAIAMLNGLQAGGYNSPELYHLKGLAILQSSKLKGRGLLAAKEFQTAAGISKHEESLFAMYVALLSSANADKAGQVLTQWRTLGASAQKSVWYLLANGIAEINAGRKAQGLAEWAKAEKVSKNKDLWHKLRENLEKDPTFFDRDTASNLRFMLPAQSPLGSLALLGQKS